jgi:hypothetical protein
MSKIASLTLTATLIGVCVPCTGIAQNPTTAQFEQLFESQMQKLKSEGFTVRSIRFEKVMAGKPSGGYYPFTVTASVHDYGPGYPPNHFYGETCVGRMDNWKFDMLQDPSGRWIVQGRMTTAGNTCKNNPSEGVSSIPLATIPGRPALTSPVMPNTKPAAAQLYLGEWDCYGAGNQLMAGMGFVLDRSGKYHDTDGARGGSYSYNAGSSSISFRGGFLAGQVGRNVTSSRMQISSTVSCEPWR